MASIKNDERLSLERLHRILRYDEKSGLFFWRLTASPKAPEGSVAGTIRKSGYRYIIIYGIPYRAARLAWFYVTGLWPETLVDHKNRARSDDRFDNLRLAGHAENLWNTGPTVLNTSGYKGVCKSKWGWQATISFRNKRIHLGLFATAEEAGAAYDAAARNLHGEFASAA